MNDLHIRTKPIFGKKSKYVLSYSSRSSRLDKPRTTRLEEEAYIPEKKRIEEERNLVK